MSSDVRGPLYEVGLNYRHGTGHGIGAYGLVHESPTQVDHHFIWFKWRKNTVINTYNIYIMKKAEALRKSCLVNSSCATICHLANLARFEYTRRRSTSCCQASSSAMSRAFTLRESLVSGLKLSSGGSSMQSRHTSLNAFNAMSGCLCVCTM